MDFVETRDQPGDDPDVADDGKRQAGFLTELIPQKDVGGVALHQVFRDVDGRPVGVLRDAD